MTLRNAFMAFVSFGGLLALFVLGGLTHSQAQVPQDAAESASIAIRWFQHSFRRSLLLALFGASAWLTALWVRHSCRTTPGTGGSRPMVLTLKLAYLFLWGSGGIESYLLGHRLVIYHPYYVDIHKPTLK